MRVSWRIFFHGNSSGSDVQVVYQKQPLIFKSVHNFEVFQPSWSPHIYLYNTGISSSTKRCVKKVSDMLRFPEKSERLYKQMEQSVSQSIEALKNPSEELLVQAILQACDCFDQWGLLEPLRPSIKKLKSLGALAVKPTGAGAGGCLMGLWKNPLDDSVLDKHFIPVSF